jgi:hypothetical protein
VSGSANTTRKSAFITPEYIAMLEESEFFWNKQNSLFRKRLKELREFLDTNGFGKLSPGKTHSVFSN